MRRRPAVPAVALLVTGLLVAGCGGSGGAASAGGRTGGVQPSPGPSLSGSITVFAAASLTESFRTLGARFEQAHPGTAVRFSFAASSTLAAQIGQGAPADVFASASQKTMDAVVSGGQAGGSAPFASNAAEIAVAAGNPKRIARPADLARPGVTVALCQREVPCGALADQVLARAGVTVTPVTREADVRAALTKVQLGEVDAAIVYVTDVRAAAGRVQGVPVPPEQNASTRYPIAALTGSRRRAVADAFVAYVLSPDGQSVLRAAGFAPP